MRKIILSLLFATLVFVGCENPESAIFIDNPEFIPDSGIYQQAILKNVKSILVEYNLDRYKNKKIALEIENNNLKSAGGILEATIESTIKKNEIVRVVPVAKGQRLVFKENEKPDFVVYMNIIISGGYVTRNVFYDKYNSVVEINFIEENQATGEKNSRNIIMESGEIFNVMNTLFCRGVYLLIVLFIFGYGFLWLKKRRLD